MVRDASNSRRRHEETLGRAGRKTWNCEETGGRRREGTRNGEERAKSPERDHAKRHKEQKRECGATRNKNGKVPCRNEQ